MNPFRRLFVTIFIFIGSFFGGGVALAWYRGDTYHAPEGWPFILVVCATVALARLLLQEPERP